MTAIHPFERAGLGKAPFKYLGCDELRGPIRTEIAGGVWIEVGAPGQPMGTCDYCGTGIALCCRIRSADGHEHIVGSDCILKLSKASNKTLTDVERELAQLGAAVRRDANARRRERQAKRDSEIVEAAKAKLPTVRAALAAQRHPHIEGKTLADYVDWLLANTGLSGQAKAAHIIVNQEAQS